jgi:alkanesulfonate monooxygenase SsuD/methylene tetrahydromethanopterin reductase-like flavin-dependent oxidoreductase (luciferase family)
MKAIDFAWTMPTGSKRLPPTSDFTAQTTRILERIHGRFHSAWMPDHFMDSDNPVPEALITLSYFAGLFPQLQWGTAVLGQSYRNPALLAKMAATLQQHSKGKYILGIGAGWKEDEYRAYNYPFPKASQRIAEMIEAIQICRALWDPAQEAASFAGRYYQIDGAVCLPKPLPPPPVMIGGGGEKLTLRAVAEHADWWNLPGAAPETFRRKLTVLEKHCAAVGRDIDEIRKSWMGVVCLAATKEKAEALRAEYPIWPGDVPLVGTPTAVIAQLQTYINCGIDLFILSFADEPSTAGIQMFLNEVMPAFSG